MSNLGEGRVLRNEGGGLFLQVYLEFRAQLSERPEWADLDNDGYLELILTHSAGTYIYKNDGGDLEEVVDQPLAPARGIAVADYDNDGDIDVLQKGPGVLGTITRLLRNNGGNVFSSVATIFPDLPSDGAMEWKDFDYDGDWDLLLGGGAADLFPVRLYRNELRGAFVETLANLPADSREVSWIDYDNDRRIDVIVGGILVFRNLGSSFSNVTATAGLSGGNNGVWGDFDGDGWYDAMLAGTVEVPSRARMFRNSANGTFAEVETSLPALQEDGSAWGDYDNDGDLDLAMVGGMAKLVRNNLGTPNVLPTVPTNLSARVLSGGQVMLHWSPSTDSGVWASITYNLRVGRTPGGIDVMSPEADLATGWRRVARVGNAGSGSFWKLWLPPGQYYWSVQAIDSSFAGSQFSEEGTFVITAAHEIVQDVVSAPEILWSTNGHTGEITDLGFSGDGRFLVSGAWDQAAKLWSVSTRSLVRGVSIGNSEVGALVSVAVSRDGSLFGAGDGDGGMRVWSASDGQRLWIRDRDNTGVFGIAFNRSNDLLAYSNLGDFSRSSSIALVDGPTGSTGFWIEDEERGVYGVSFSSDGTLLASAHDSTVTIRRVQDAAPLRYLIGHTRGVTSVDFAPTGTLLASAAADGTARLWNATNGLEMRVIEGGGGRSAVPIWEDAGRVRFSADGKTLLTRSNSTLRFWRVADGKLLLTYSNVGTGIFAVSPDGKHFAYGTGFWGLGPRSVVLARMPLLITHGALQTNRLNLEWQGGTGLYQVQQKTNLTGNVWDPVGSPTTATSVSIAATNRATFFRIQSLDPPP